MTHEEAIEYFEEFQREIDELYHYADGNGKATLDEQREPIAIAISALRELDAKEKQEQLVGDEWTSVEDHLPEFTGEYMCRVVTPTVYGKYSVRHLSLKFCQYDDSWVCSDMIVTHWMPMLKEPENGKFV